MKVHLNDRVREMLYLFLQRDFKLNTCEFLVNLTLVASLDVVLRWRE